VKRRAYREWEYWGRPVPGFGDPRASLLIVGLAPAAHGANRTGRMFTGDRSGDFLYRLLHREKFATQGVSRRRDDGLRLRKTYISAVCRCAPPDNKPLPEEMANCRGYLAEEMRILRPRAVLALGKTAFEGFLTMLRMQGRLPARPASKFAHGAEFELPGALPRLFCSYHPSQQNTQTGRLNEKMLLRVLRRIRRFIEE